MLKWAKSVQNQNDTVNGKLVGLEFPDAPYYFLKSAQSNSTLAFARAPLSKNAVCL